MNILTIIGMAIVCTILCVLLKQYKPEYALIVSIACISIIFISLIGELEPIIEQVNSLVQQIKIGNEYIVILIKALGITYIVELASDICKDAGQTAIASKVELAGKLAIIILCIPLLQNLLDLSTKLING